MNPTSIIIHPRTRPLTAIRRVFIPLFVCSIFASASPTLAQRPATRSDAAATTSLATAILQGARDEARRGTPYVMEYEVIDYPGGDVTSGTGVCTDLVVRAFRRAGVDLQREVYLDRKARPGAYPRIWERHGIDRNIDHRRCPNLVAWFRRYGRELTTELEGEALAEWQAGDVVFYVREGATHPWHVGIVSDRRDGASGLPMIIDSFPPRTTESHRIDEFAPVHSHFRLEKWPQ